MTELRIAVLGVGMMGAYHARTLSAHTKGATVAIVSDVDVMRAGAVATEVGARVVPDPLDAIADPGIDAVLIATPGAAHAAQLQACLDRGLPVLCEKPLTTDSAAAYRIVQQEARLGQPLIQVGFMRRFDPEYVRLRELIAAEELGRPLMMHCTHRNLTVGPHFSTEFMITDSVVHEIDAARFLLAEEIAAIQVLAGRSTSTAPEGASDPILVVLETESGVLVTDECFVRTGVGYEVRTELVGERGSAVIGLDQHLVARGTDGRWGGAIPPDFLGRFDQAYRSELQRWVDAAHSGSNEGPGAWDGYAAAAVCEAGVAAVRDRARTAVRLRPRPDGARAG